MQSFSQCVAGGINVLAGLWLVVSSFMPGMGPAWNFLVVGTVITIFAAARFLRGVRASGLSWINAALGAWLIVSPSVFGSAAVRASTWSSIVTGVIVLVMALASAAAGEPEAAEAWPSPWFPSGRQLPWYDVNAPYGMWPPEEHGAYRGVGPKGYRRPDDRIRDALCDAMTQHPGLDATNIEIQVVDGDVTLSGSVPDRHARRLAEDITMSIGGVRDVRNDLRLRVPSTVPQSRRVA